MQSELEKFFAEANKACKNADAETSYHLLPKAIKMLDIALNALSESEDGELFRATMRRLKEIASEALKD